MHAEVVPLSIMLLSIYWDTLPCPHRDHRDTVTCPHRGHRPRHWETVTCPHRDHRNTGTPWRVYAATTVTLERRDISISRPPVHWDKVTCIHRDHHDTGTLGHRDVFIPRPPRHWDIMTCPHRDHRDTGVGQQMCCDNTGYLMICSSLSHKIVFHLAVFWKFFYYFSRFCFIPFNISSVGLYYKFLYIWQ